MPMEQFEIKGILAPLLIFIFILSKNYKKIIPSNYQILDESIFRTILLILLNNLHLHQLFFFPLLYSLFLVLFLSNLLGLIPYSSTPSVEIILTLSIAFTLLFGILFYALFIQHGKFLTHLFLPAGTPAP